MKNILFLCALCSSPLLTGCLNIAGDCETTIVSRKLNPAKTLQAVYDATDCGATTTPSSGLRILETVDPKDNGEPKNTVAGSGAGFWYDWKSNDTLVVQGVDTTNGYTV